MDVQTSHTCIQQHWTLYSHKQDTSVSDWGVAYKVFINSHNTHSFTTPTQFLQQFSNVQKHTAVFYFTFGGTEHLESGQMIIQVGRFFLLPLLLLLSKKKINRKSVWLKCWELFTTRRPLSRPWRLKTGLLEALSLRLGPPRVGTLLSVGTFRRWPENKNFTVDTSVHWMLQSVQKEKCHWKMLWRQRKVMP